MRKLALIAVMALAASPAFAGVVNFNNGQGSWRPSHCQKPVPPSASVMNSEAPATLLNQRGVNFNQYAQASEQYMRCLTQEAQVDANAAGQTVLNSLAQEVQNTQAEVNRERAAIYQRR
jgi:hypothetical protein